MGQLVLGVLAGLKDASDDNLTHLKEPRRRAAQAARRGGADRGRRPRRQQRIARGAALGALAADGLPLPILVVAGNREVRTDLDAAVASLRKRGTQLIDLSHTRIVDLGDVLIVGLAGVFDRRLLRADGACLYAQSDIDALAAFLDRSAAMTAPPALMVAAVPPHGEGPQAIDATDGQNVVGEMRFIPRCSPRRARGSGSSGRCGKRAAARSINRTRSVDAPGAASPVTQLYVNPGAADRTPWPMNDGSTSHGLAALVTIRGRQASYESIREPAAPARSP